MKLHSAEVAWVGAFQQDQQTLITGEFRESSPDAILDGFSGPREMSQCQHVIASGARDVRCADTFEAGGDVHGAVVRRHRRRLARDARCYTRVSCARDCGVARAGPRLVRTKTPCRLETSEGGTFPNTASAFACTSR